MCSFTSKLWIQLLKLIRPTCKKARPLGAKLKWILNFSKHLPVLCSILKLLFNATVYHIWMERNLSRFGDQVRSIKGICSAIFGVVLTQSNKFKARVVKCQQLGGILARWEVDTSRSGSGGKTCRWVRPKEGCWALNCDEALTDDRVGYGGILRESAGVPAIAYYGLASKRHILWAELQAIQRGIYVVLSRGLNKLKIISDLKLTVDILHKDIACPWKVLTLVHDLWKLLGCLSMVEIVHVWHEANQPADLIARMDGGTEEIIIFPCDFPTKINLIISKDASGCIYNKTQIFLLIHFFY